jgi:UrcA family protein
MCANRFFVFSAAFTFLLGFGLFARVDAVMAQQADYARAGQDVEEVVVIEASIDEQLGKRPPTGYKTDPIQIKRHVSYADLDLDEPADVQELEQRIEMAAQEACETLERSFPLGQKSMADVRRCVIRAIEGTKETFDAVVARAH